MSDEKTEPSAPTPAAGDEPPWQSAPDRAAWLMLPVSLIADETISAARYNELVSVAVALRARAEEAERKLSDVADLQRSTAADLDAARAQLRMVSAGPADVWRWQGDGGDEPESLACPVVMSAETLREFVAARERVAELEEERENLLDEIEGSGELNPYALTVIESAREAQKGASE